MSRRVYLCARYSRRLEMQQHATKLREAGFTVSSRWIDGLHQSENDGTVYGDEAKKFAEEDIADLMNSDILLAFTEPHGSPHSRGGRHVEFGIALANGLDIAIVGERENVFYWLPQVVQYVSVDEFVDMNAANRIGNAL